MFNDLYLKAGAVRIALERGDADSSGSTIRTLGVVSLILIIFGVLAAAVAATATQAGVNVKPPF